MHVAECVVLAVVARGLACEKPAERVDRLVEQPAAVGARGEPRLRQLELLAVGADPDARDHAAVAELVERGELLREQHGLARAEDQHSRRETGAARDAGGRGEDDDDLVEARRVGVVLADVGRRRDVIVSPERVVAELVAEHEEIDELVRAAERQRQVQALLARGQRDAELHRAAPAAAPSR
jgi:hypothetical protein